MIHWMSHAIEAIMYLYCIVFIINYQVFVYDYVLKFSRNSRNKSMIKALLNPFSLLSQRKVKISIMSGELKLAENLLHIRRSVLTEKYSMTVELKKCNTCNKAPIFSAKEWSSNLVCVECQCGKLFLTGADGLKFQWPFSITSLYEYEELKSAVEDLSERSVKAMKFDWNKLPDMPQRDETIVLMKEAGIIPPEFRATADPNR